MTRFPKNQMLKKNIQVLKLLNGINSLSVVGNKLHENINTKIILKKKHTKNTKILIIISKNINNYT